MLTEIFSGDLEPGETSPWVAVPQSSIYTIHITGYGAVECSNNGTDVAGMSGGRTEALATYAGTDTSRIYRIASIPVGYMRIRGGGTSTQSITAFVASV